MQSLLSLVTILLVPVLTPGQLAQAQPAFEVASVKVSPPIGGQNAMVGMRIDPGRVRYANLGLKTLIMMAYGVADDQIVNVPAGFRYPLAYEIVATLPVNADKEQIPGMLQSLLADRFRLVVHSETKETPVYALVVAKNGLKMKLSEAEKLSLNARQRGHFEAKKITMEMFANYCKGLGFADRPVLDKTGLAGFYDLTLDWTPDDMKSDDLPSHPSLFTAIQDQLGLKLEAQKAPREFFVVDHAEKPAEN